MVEGTQIGSYRIVKPLGAGGMSEVFVAEHALLGRRAAIKVLRARLSRQSSVVRRLFNEARIMTAIANPGIVQIFDFGFHVDGSAYIVMELLEGETLDARLARLGPLAVPEALHLVRQIASALCAAHARGVVHRDLKPENIFLARDAEVVGGERVKLLDFGIAKLIGDDAGTTQESEVLGTPSFMSPEQCRGADTVEQRSDLYSLGCVLFTMVTGRPPFGEAGPAELLALHQLEPAPVPSQCAPGIPRVVDQLVLRCMAKEPAERFTACELARAIGALVHTPWQWPELSPESRLEPANATSLLGCDTRGATLPVALPQTPRTQPMRREPVAVPQAPPPPRPPQPPTQALQPLERPEPVVGAVATAFRCDTRGATQPLVPERAPLVERPSLVERVLRTAFVAEIAVLALVICGMAWLALVLMSRLAT